MKSSSQVTANGAIDGGNVYDFLKPGIAQAQIEKKVELQELLIIEDKVDQIL